MTTGGGLRVEEVTAAGELGCHRKEWEGLAERAPHAELFETHPWITAWLETYWKDRPLAFLFVRSGEELVGLAPLLDDHEGLVGCPHSLVTPVNRHARRCSLLTAADPGAVVEAILGHVECTRRMLRIRNTVILDEVYCEPPADGSDDYAGCHRTCFLFWKEAWLERA